MVLSTGCVASVVSGGLDGAAGVGVDAGTLSLGADAGGGEGSVFGDGGPVEGGASPDGGRVEDAGLAGDGGGSLEDGGGSLEDGGPPGDGGPRDAGARADAGPEDAGALPDAGRFDAGVSADAGVGDAAVPDAGTPLPVVDAGLPQDAGCLAGATAACVTSCGSGGTTSCSGGAWGPCVPPPESCNLADDDCDGVCDDRMGCRIGVDRAFNGSAGLHFYTTDDAEASCCGYQVETYDAFYLYDSPQPGLLPFYRCRTSAGAHLYTTDGSCDGESLEGTLGWIATGAACGSVPLYDLYQASTGDHLYTESGAEVSSAEGDGYVLQGTAGYVWPGACGGAGCVWPSPVAMAGSARVEATGFPTAWYGFPIPAGASFSSLAGSVSLSQSQDLYSEVLFILQDLPSGACPAGRWPASTPEFGPPGAVGIGQFIVKAPAHGTFSLPLDFTLPGGLPIGHCLLLGLNGGPVSTAHDMTSAADLTLNYTTAPSAQRLIGLGGEFCFGQDWGCQRATTDDSRSFAKVTPVGQTTRLVALYGDVSDTTFDGTSAFGAPPAGAWTAKNDFYVYHGAECSSFGVASGIAGPGDYYGAIPPDATLLLSVPLSGSGIGVATRPVFKTFRNLSIAAGDCLVTLWGLSGGGGFDDETQVAALVAP